MRSSVEEKIEKLGFSLPKQCKPSASYVSYTLDDSVVYVSGQTCRSDGSVVYQGAVGRDLSMDEAVAAAELCALNLLFQLRLACKGNLDRIHSCKKLTVYINTIGCYSEHSKVADGASNILTALFGGHARSAVGVNSLPGGASIEIDGIFKLNG